MVSAFVLKGPVQTVEAHIAAMQCGNVVLVQWRMIRLIVQSERSIGDTVGVATHNSAQEARVAGL